MNSIKHDLEIASHESLQRIVTVTARMMRAPYAALLVPDGDMLRVGAASGLFVRTIPAAMAPCLRVIEEQRTISIDDLSADPATKTLAAYLGDENINAYAGTPVYRPSGECFAALCVLHERHKPLYPGWHDLLIGCAALAEAAIGALEYQTTDDSAGASMWPTTLSTLERGMSRPATPRTMDLAI